MTKLQRSVYWPAAIGAYWLSSLLLLFRAFPVHDDGYGITASFFFGSHPPRTYPEILYPYWAAATVLTFFGIGVTTLLVRFVWPKTSRLFLASSATALISLLLLAAVSDVGIALHIWWGGTVYWNLSSIFLYLKVIAPISVFTGLLTVLQHRLSGSAAVNG